MYLQDSNKSVMKVADVLHHVLLVLITTACRAHAQSHGELEQLHNPTVSLKSFIMIRKPTHTHEFS